MSIKDIKEFAILRYQGDSTIQQRLKILENQKLVVEKEKAKWESNLQNLNDKIEIYKNKLNNKVPVPFCFLTKQSVVPILSISDK